MLHMKGIKPYLPDDPWLGAVVYLRDEEGNDWYLSQPLWGKDTVKIFYDPREGNQICAITKDVTGVTPEDLNVVEMHPDDVPERASANPEEGWVYLDGIVSRPVARYEEEARSIRNAFLAATDALMVFDYTIEDEILSQELRREAALIRVQMKGWPKTEGWPFVPLPEMPDWLLKEAGKNGFKNPQWP